MLLIGGRKAVPTVAASIKLNNNQYEPLVHLVRSFSVKSGYTFDLHCKPLVCQIANDLREANEAHTNIDCVVVSVLVTSLPLSALLGQALIALMRSEE